MTSNTDDRRGGVYIEFPLPEERLFRNQATQDILLFFLRNPHTELTVTELRNVTDHGGDTVQTAITVLEAADLITTQREGRKKLISPNREHFHSPDDPLFSIPQDEFRVPIKNLLDKLADTEIDVVGVIVFGSVARGEADRTSDIDILVIVDNEVTAARREIQTVRQEVENERFDGNRYEFQVLVESVDTASNYGEKLQEIFTEGITLIESEQLDDVREAVFDGG